MECRAQILSLTREVPGLVRVVIALEKLSNIPDDVDVDNMIDELLETAKKCYLGCKRPVSFTRYDLCCLYFRTDIEIGMGL